MQKVNKSLIFEVKNKMYGYEVSLGLKRRGPMTCKIDLMKKELVFQVTPEGIRKGIEVAKKFLNDSSTVEKWAAFNDKWEKWLQEKKKEAPMR